MGAVTDFAAETAVTQVDDGRYNATMTEGWSVPRGANGGVVAATVLRAMQTSVDDEAMTPRSLTTHFLRPPAPGKVTIAVVVERRGRNVAAVSARMWQGEKLMLLALGAFGGPFPPGTDIPPEPMPDVGSPPSELPTFRRPEGVWLPTVAERCRLLPKLGAHPQDRGGDESVSGGWMRLDEPATPDAAALTFYSDAWIPTPFMRLNAMTLVPTVDLTVHFRQSLPHHGTDAQTPVLGRFSMSGASDGYFVEDGEIWAPDGTLLAQSRQLGCLIPVSSISA